MWKPWYWPKQPPFLPPPTYGQMGQTPDPAISKAPDNTSTAVQKMASEKHFLCSILKLYIYGYGASLILSLTLSPRPLRGAHEWNLHTEDLGRWEHHILRTADAHSFATFIWHQLAIDRSTPFLLSSNHPYHPRLPLKPGRCIQDSILGHVRLGGRRGGVIEAFTTNPPTADRTHIRFPGTVKSNEDLPRVFFLPLQESGFASSLERSSDLVEALENRARSSYRHPSWHGSSPGGTRHERRTGDSMGALRQSGRLRLP